MYLLFINAKTPRRRRWAPTIHGDFPCAPAYFPGDCARAMALTLFQPFGTDATVPLAPPPRHHQIFFFPTGNFPFRHHQLYLNFPFRNSRLSVGAKILVVVYKHSGCKSRNYIWNLILILNYLTCEVLKMCMIAGLQPLCLFSVHPARLVILSLSNLTLGRQPKISDIF